MNRAFYDLAEPHDPISPLQVAPTPQSELDANVDRLSVVRAAIREHPQASVDEIVDELAKRQIEVSATLVMQELMHAKQAQHDV